MIRRSLVFAVCALGVGCLYLAPSTARSPDQLGSVPTNKEPKTRAGGALNAPAGSSPRSEPTRQAQTSKPPTGAEQAGSDAGSVDQDSPATPLSPRDARATRAATAYDTGDSTDYEPPQPVRQISTATVTADRLGLTWSPARDNVGVVGYHVWLNGFEVASTAETHATVRWFNDDTATHVVQVKAVDAAGNESETSPSVLVSRPDPKPTTTARPPANPTRTPQPSPQPTASGEQPSAPGETPGAAPTTGPTGAPNGTT